MAEPVFQFKEGPASPRFNYDFKTKVAPGETEVSVALSLDPASARTYFYLTSGSGSGANIIASELRLYRGGMVSFTLPMKIYLAGLPTTGFYAGLSWASDLSHASVDGPLINWKQDGSGGIAWGQGAGGNPYARPIISIDGLNCSKAEFYAKVGSGSATFGVAMAVLEI